MNNTIGTNEISIDYFGLEPISIGVFTNDFGNTIFKYMCSNLFIWKIFQYNLMLIIYKLEFKKNLIKTFCNVPPAVSKSSQTMPLANLAFGRTCLSNILVKRSLSSRIVLSLSSPISANASSVGARIVKGPSKDQQQQKKK